MAVLFGAKILTFCAFVVSMELYIIRHWNDHLDELKMDNNFLSLMDITPFLTGHAHALQKVFNSKKLMFFLVASGKAVTSPREVCAIESASHHNPSMTILVVFVQPANKLWLEENVSLIEVMRCWPNVRLATVNATAAMNHAGLSRLAKEIPLGTHPALHTSDVLRVLLVLKFGGVFTDLDLITLNSLQSVVYDENFVVGDDFQYFSNSFFGFRRNHSLAERILDTMRADFNNTEQNFGPLALTCAIERYCKKPTRQLLLGSKCAEANVQVVNFTSIDQCHKDNYLNDVTPEVYDEYSKKFVAFHLLYKVNTAPSKQSIASLSLYGQAIQSFCPISLHAGNGDTF